MAAAVVALMVKGLSCPRHSQPDADGGGASEDSGGSGAALGTVGRASGDSSLRPAIVQGPQKFLLYRLIGNDMPPLQCQGQLYKNLKFTLEQESRQLPECRKLWVLNNVVNATERALMIDLLVSRGYTTKDILVRRINFTRLQSADRAEWTRMVTAQNEARNFILEHGKRQSGARWILPFDGNQFFSDEAWDSIRHAAREHEAQGLKYFKVPMFRLYHEQRATWLWSGTLFPALKEHAPFLWESQMAFRNDSSELYREDLPYGKDNKLEFIDRVCGTAKFDAAGKEGQEAAAEGSEADRKQCGCHREVGNDRKVREFDPAVAAKCGYSVRLWYFPCKSVRTSIIFTNPNYRRKLRKEGHEFLGAEIRSEMEEWARREEHLRKYKAAVNASLPGEASEEQEGEKKQDRKGGGEKKGKKQNKKKAGKKSDD